MEAGFFLETDSPGITLEIASSSDSAHTDPHKRSHTRNTTEMVSNFYPSEKNLADGEAAGRWRPEEFHAGFQRFFFGPQPDGLLTGLVPWEFRCTSRGVSG